MPFGVGREWRERALGVACVQGFVSASDDLGVT